MTASPIERQGQEPQANYRHTDQQLCMYIICHFPHISSQLRWSKNRWLLGHRTLPIIHCLFFSPVNVSFADHCEVFALCNYKPQTGYCLQFSGATTIGSQFLLTEKLLEEVFWPKQAGPRSSFGYLWKDILENCHLIHLVIILAIDVAIPGKQVIVTG